MTFADLLQFMTERDPGFRQGLVGVPPDDIKACEQERGIVLPRVYVDFLLAMGVDSGRHHPLGRDKDANFYRVLRQLPPIEYDAQQTFPVGQTTDEHRITISDLYMDLRTRDGNDVELVSAERDADWDPEDNVRQTLLEFLTWNAWRGFEAFRRQHNRILFLHGTRQDLDGLRDSAVELLGELGFAPVLPGLGRINCLQSSSAGAVVRINAGLVDLVVAGDDDKELGKILEVFLKQVPGSSVSKKYRSIHVY